jgi:hypothetical protein
MPDNNKSTSNGLGLGTVLFLIFLTLKLGGWGVVATWSWWWVFSPLWIPIILLGLVVLVAFLINQL